MSYVIDIGTALPEYRHGQDDFASFYGSMAGTEEQKRKIALIAKRSRIDQRHSAFPHLEDLFNMGLSEKMALFHREAFELALQATRNNPAYPAYSDHITHIITVSCTGMQAPGIETELIEALALKPTVSRLNINLMGCYAAITALKVADDICRSHPEARVLVVCVELCTLHFQKRFDDNYILSNLLFADGAASLIVSAQKGANKAFEVSSFYSRLFSRAKDDMSWKLSESGFLMRLTTAVPEIIKAELRENEVLKKLEQLKGLCYAIHPGGLQIVESVKSALQISDAHAAPAMSILKQYGNMSSPSVLFVLKELQAQFMESDRSDVPVFGCSFGPGLAFESFNLVYV